MGRIEGFVKVDSVPTYRKGHRPAHCSRVQRASVLLLTLLPTNQQRQPFLQRWLSMDYQDRISIEPGKRGGKPCIRGMRITVYDVLDYLASGMSEQEVLDDFPNLTRDDICACLAFVADRERGLVSFGGL